MRERWLVVRREEGLWAIPGRFVEAVRRDEATYSVRAAGLELVVDEVLGMEGNLKVRSIGSLVSRLAPRGCHGLAVSHHGPLVVVDPADPPPALINHDTSLEGE